MKERAITYSSEMVLARLEGRKNNTRRIAKVQSPRAKCPYGGPGDRLWVREGYTITGWSVLGGRVEVHGFYSVDRTPFHVWLALRETKLFLNRKIKTGSLTPRFMYRVLSRGLDEVVSVRLERVQEISEGNARAEGVKAALWFEPAGKPPSEHYHVDGVLATRRRSYRNAFATLWEKIHGPGAWARNEWVWVVKFRRLE